MRDETNTAIDVRECMGWRLGLGHRFDPYKSWFRPGADRPERLGEAVTVDDMIAWLRSSALVINYHGYRFRDVSAWRSTTDEPNEACSVTTVLDERYDVHFHGATLHEALIKTVRAVAALSREDPKP